MARLMTYLLGEAREAGVEWYVEDGDLLLRGPRSAEPIVQELLARREELRATLLPRLCVDCGTACGGGVRCSDCADTRRQLRRWDEA